MAHPPFSANDLEVIEQLRREGVVALAGFFSSWRARIERLVTVRIDSRLRGRLDVGDILQEVFLDAAKRLKTYLANPAAPPFIWFRGIAVNTLTDAHRRHLGAQARDAGREVSLNRGQAASATSLCLAEQLAGSMTSPSQAMLRTELAETLARAIDQMEVVDREILVLRHFEQLRNSEAAIVLGISENACSNRYIRALGRLRTILSAVPGLSFDATLNPAN